MRGRSATVRRFLDQRELGGPGVQIQGVGRLPGVSVAALKVGMLVMFNYAHVYEVVSKTKVTRRYYDLQLRKVSGDESSSAPKGSMWTVRKLESALMAAKRPDDGDWRVA